MSRKIAVILSGLAALIVLLVFFQQTFLYQPERAFTDKLNTVISSDLNGWSVTDIPMDETEEGRNRVEGILQYTDALVRQYNRGDMSFMVYVAYWAPKTMPVRLVQAHTPEVCWVRAGWDLDRSVSSSAVELVSGGDRLLPAEYRELTIGETTRSRVYYWHVIGDRVYSSDQEAGKWNRWDPILSLFRLGLNQQTEQFFVRISSETPFEKLKQTPGFQKIMDELSELALAPNELSANNTPLSLPGA